MPPRALVLGTAQDGGLPQPGCACRNCARAREDPRFARPVACLGLLDGDRRFLVDATPDLREQLGSDPRLDGLLLTHAHMGHVAGLLWLGREAMAVRNVPVWMGGRLREHLLRNEPWASLLRNGHLEPRVVRDGVEEEISDGLRVTPVAVPHRAEWSETFAFRISGPERTVLWLPDIDRFEEETLTRLLDGVDLAFLDGTFWSADELPGRDLTEIPHPFVRDTLATLARIRPRAAVAFVHLNHSNPLLDESSEECRMLGSGLRASGIRVPGGSPVAEVGFLFEL